MKVEWKTCIRIGVCAMILFLCIYYWRTFAGFIGIFCKAATPLLAGCIIAYVVNILMDFYEKLYFPTKNGRFVEKSRTPVCMLFAFFTLVLILVFLLVLVIPELSRCIQLLVAGVPALFNSLMEKLAQVNVVSKDASAFFEEINWKEVITKLVETLKSGIGGTVNIAVGVVSSAMSFVINFVIGFIFAIYLLLEKRKLKNQCGILMKRYLPASWNQKIIYALSILNDCFHRYIVGQCTEAVILGVLCAVGMLIFRFPYALIIGAVVGFSALIPVAGAYIGGGVGFVLILTVSPVKAFLFLAYIVVLQQLEGNIIYPKVVGSSLGLPGMWVLAAVTIGGGVYGVGGMLISVPIAAALYRILRDDVRKGKNG